MPNRILTITVLPGFILYK